MLREWKRALLRIGSVASAFCLLLSATRPSHASPRMESWPHDPDTHAPSMVVVHPQDPEQASRVFVMLHGMCGEPMGVCGGIAESASKQGWVLCPQAEQDCKGGGASWVFGRTIETLELSVERLVRRESRAKDAANHRVLMGFSLGALAAMHVAHAAKGRWPDVVLIGARVQPNLRLLRDGGVERILMGAGDFDMMSTPMRSTCRGLDRKGFACEFRSMGKVGHQFAQDMDGWTQDALGWLLQR